MVCDCGVDLGLWHGEIDILILSLHPLSSISSLFICFCVPHGGGGKGCDGGFWSRCGGGFFSGGCSGFCWWRWLWVFFFLVVGVGFFRGDNCGFCWRRWCSGLCLDWMVGFFD